MSAGASREKWDRIYAVATEKEPGPAAVAMIFLGVRLSSQWDISHALCNGDRPPLASVTVERSTLFDIH
jgi:hypothetical protein